MAQRLPIGHYFQRPPYFSQSRATPLAAAARPSRVRHRGGRQRRLFRFAADWLAWRADVTRLPADRREKPVLKRGVEAVGARRRRCGIPERRRRRRPGWGACAPDTQQPWTASAPSSLLTFSSSLEKKNLSVRDTPGTGRSCCTGAVTRKLIESLRCGRGSARRPPTEAARRRRRRQQ